MQPNAQVTIGQGPGAVTFGNSRQLAFIAGPCALESPAHAMKMAGALRDIADRLGVASSTSPPSTRRTAPRWPASAAWAWSNRSTYSRR